MAEPYGYPPRRPIGVVILAILVILAGVILTLLSLGLLFLTLLTIPTLGMIPVIIAFVILIFSIILLLAGIGLLNLRPWAWWLAMFSLVLLILGNLGAYTNVVNTGGASTGTLVGLLLPILILIYLIAVRKHFRSPPPGAAVYGPPPPRPR